MTKKFAARTAFLFLAGCESHGVAFECYVVIKSGTLDQFIAAITSIAKKEGFETAVGQAKSDTGNVLSVIEGRGHGVKLWVQNVPLSGNEDPSLCGVHNEAYADPEQFVVATEPRLFKTKSHRTAAIEVGEKVRCELYRRGFDVRLESATSGEAALNRSY